MARPTNINIDIKAIAKNAQTISNFAPQSKLLACIKADAYGHGMLQAASALQAQVNAFGVAFLDEALELREAGISTPILVLDGFYQASDLDSMQAQQLWTVVHCQEQIDLLAKTKLSGQLSVWLKMNTGMQRLGFEPHQYLSAYEALCQIDNLSVTTQMTHFARADEEDRAFTCEQHQIFHSLVSSLPGDKSLANSAGTLYYPEAHADWIRPGLALYGLYPSEHAMPNGEHIALQPAMTLHSQVLALRHIKKGTGIGYNHRWVADRDAVIAVVALGYGDGYPRDIGNGTPILVAGQRATTVGAVSMDMLFADVTDLNNVRVGSPVELWGKTLSANEVASQANLSVYELVTRLTGRVKRTYESL